MIPLRINKQIINMINKVTLIGNLGKDPEKKTLDSGKSLFNFSVATNESYKDKSGEWQNLTEWHNITYWSDYANFSKGDTVYIEGKIKTRKWQDKEGNDRYTTEIIASYVRRLNATEQQAKAVTNLPENTDLPF